MKAPSLSVVVPVYNSQAILPGLVERLKNVLPQTAESYEVILVNDGSKDGSWAAIVDIASRESFVRGIDLMRNYGQHNALLCGIREAKFDVIVTMDDDLQNPPEEIPALLAELEKGWDVVYGVPLHEQHGVWRDLASIITKTALKGAIGAQTARKASAFRALKTRLRDSFQAYRSPYVSVDVLLTWGTTRFGAVQVRHDARLSGPSNYTFWRLVTHASNMMTGFSTWPLQLASAMGFAMTLFGLAILAYVVGRYLLQGGGVPGFPFLASIIAIFSGAQLFALGIIGEYLARMHFRMMDRPTFAVRSTTETVG